MFFRIFSQRPNNRRDDELSDKLKSEHQTQNNPMGRLYVRSNGNPTVIILNLGLHGTQERLNRRVDTESRQIGVSR